MEDGRKRPGPRYLALGDSYTIGVGVASAERWPVQLAALLRDRGVAMAEPVIIAQDGWTTDELAAGIDQARPCGPYEPALGNDVRDVGSAGASRGPGSGPQAPRARGRRPF